MWLPRSLRRIPSAPHAAVTIKHRHFSTPDPPKDAEAAQIESLKKLTKEPLNAHLRPETNEYGIEEQFRRLSWEEYEELANERKFLVEYSRRAVLLTKNRKFGRDIQYIFAFSTLLAVPLVAGYIANVLWKNNRAKRFQKEAEQENDFFQRKRLESFVLHDPSGRTGGLEGQAEILTSRENPFEHFLRISVEQPRKKILPDPHSLRCLFIPASELSQVYTNDYSSPKEEFVFQSPLELSLRLQAATVDLKENTIFIPRSAGNYQKGQTYPMDHIDSPEYREYRSWFNQVFTPTLLGSMFAGTVAFFVSKHSWKKTCSNPVWITKAIYSPWRQGFLLGGRVALLTATVSSFISFLVLYGSYCTQTLYFSKEEQPHFESLEKGNPWLQAPSLCVIFTVGSVLLSSFFTLPLGAITGRIVTGKLYQEMVQILPRSTIAIRRFTRSFQPR